jgi:hypothetical protein
MPELPGTLEELLRSSAVAPGPPFVSNVSVRQSIVELQVGKVLAGVGSCFGRLADTPVESGRRAGLIEFTRCPPTVSLAEYFGPYPLRSYGFVVIPHAARPHAATECAWALATGTLLCWTVSPGRPEQAWQITLFNWLAGGLLLVLVRLAIAQTGRAPLRARSLNHNAVFIDDGAEARGCTQWLRFDRGGANLARLRLKPGMTGSGQVIGWRVLTNIFEHIQKRVAHGRYYIENLSAQFDQRMLLRTAIKGFNRYYAF